MTNMNISYRHAQGFTLIEMAIVLLIMGLLLGAGLTVLSTQIEQQKIKDTQRLLEDAKDALIGFALANGRLPCPATAASNGLESPIGGGACSASLAAHDGFLPAATLGIPGVDANGFLPDAWQTSTNRIRYAVSAANAPGPNANAATTTDGIRTATMVTYAPTLRVCASATGITGTTCGAATVLTNSAVAVIYSLGKDSTNAGPDQAANQNGDQVFVSHTPTATFDDQLTWLPSSILYNRMLQAGRLP